MPKGVYIRTKKHGEAIQRGLNRPESISKRRIISTEIMSRPEVIEKLRKSATGKHHTEESKEKIRQARLRYERIKDAIDPNLIVW